MNELVHIGESDISVKEYNGQRVVTFKDIDTVHQRADGTARKRFNDNKRHLIEGEDYFVRKTDEAKEEYGIIAPNGLVLLTESGYLMLVKSFTDDLAWDVQRKLVSSYFKVKELASEELSPQMQLIMQMVNNMAQKELADKERDRQIALAQETAEKAVETTERMKDEIISPFDNWRDDINKKVRQISMAWDSMKNRCFNKRPGTESWNGKGIKVCEEWLGKTGFKNFYKWAINNGYSDQLTLDRIDNNKDYSPDNCRWADYIIQNNNSSNNVMIEYHGEIKTISQWAKEYGINYQTLYSRIKRGCEIGNALNKSAKRRCEK